MSIVVVMDTLQSRLKFLRVSTGLSSRGLSRAARLTSETHWATLEETKEHDPRSSTLRKIAETCGVSLDWLMCGVGEVPTAEAIKSAVEALSRPAPPEAAAS